MPKAYGRMVMMEHRYREETTWTHPVRIRGQRYQAKDPEFKSIFHQLLAFSHLRELRAISHSVASSAPAEGRGISTEQVSEPSSTHAHITCVPISAFNLLGLAPFSVILD